jgi:hypothetical protein
MSVDFHVTPKAGLNNAWSAEGHYYNDNGTVLSTDNNSNFYLINVVGFNMTGSIVSVNVNTYGNAVGFNGSNGTANCTAVNNNDFLGNISLYNAKMFSQMTTLTVFAITLGGVNTTVGTATYNAMSDRLETNLLFPVCLPSLS